MRNPLKSFMNSGGQSVTEFSLLTVMLILGVMFGSLHVFPAFIKAFQLYFDSYYTLLNLPIP